MSAQDTSLFIKCITTDSLETVHRQCYYTISAVVDNIFYEVHQTSWRDIAERYCPGITYSYARDLNDTTLYFMLKSAPELKELFDSVDVTTWENIVFVNNRTWVPTSTANKWMLELGKILDTLKTYASDSISVRIYSIITKVMIKNTMAQFDAIIK